MPLCCCCSDKAVVVVMRFALLLFRPPLSPPPSFRLLHLPLLPLNRRGDVGDGRLEWNWAEPDQSIGGKRNNRRPIIGSGEKRIRKEREERCRATPRPVLLLSARQLRPPAAWEPCVSVASSLPGPVAVSVLLILEPSEEPAAVPADTRAAPLCFPSARLSIGYVFLSDSISLQKGPLPVRRPIDIKK